MTDYHHIVDQIRSFLAATDQTRTPELSELAGSYAGLCKEANERLRRSVDCLRRGMRSEAIHLADQQPALLDLVAALDMAEIAEWEGICAMYELPRPARLLIDAAQELNEAYAAEQPLKALLDRHRRLALSRAPLSQRIATMRELGKLDLQNQVWEEDVRTFEKVRLKELAGEAVAATKANDRQRLANLLLEISDAGWRVEVPKDLHQRLEQVVHGHRCEEATTRVRELLPELDIAYSAMDQAACTRLLSLIRKLAESAQMKMPPDIAEQVYPVEQWVQQEELRQQQKIEFDAACGQLDTALNHNVATAELERLKQAALALGFELPDELSARFRQEIQKRERLHKIKVRLGAALAGCFLIGVAVSAFFLIRSGVRDRRARDIQASLKVLINNDELDRAYELWQQVEQSSPEIADRGDMRALKLSLEEQLLVERKRRAEFRSHMDAAGTPTNPRQAELEAAALIARTVVEKREVAQLRDKIDAASQERQRLEAQRAETERAKREAEFKRQMALLSTETARVEAAIRQEKATDEDIQELEKIAGPLAEADVDAILKRELNLLRDRLRNGRAAIALQQKESVALEQVRKSLGSAAELKQALADYATQLPASPRAEQFRKAAADASAWEAVDEWVKLSSAWDRLTPADDQIEQRVKALQGYADKYGDSPFATAVNEYKDYLARAQNATAIDGSWKGTYKRLVATPLVRELRCVRLTDGKVYYVVGNGDFGEDSVGTQFQAVVTADVSKTRRVVIKKNSPAKVQGPPVPSPQVAMAASLTKAIDGVSPENWEMLGLEVIQVIQQSSETDPLLRAILLDRAISQMLVAGWGGNEAFRGFAEKLSELNAGDTAWMDPEDSAANDARSRAAALMDKLPDLRELRAAVKTRRQTLSDSVSFGLSAHAVALRVGGSWSAYVSGRLSDGQSVYAARPTAGASALYKVGTTKAGQISFNDAAMAGIPEGTMLFVCSKRK